MALQKKSYNEYQVDCSLKFQTSSKEKVLRVFSGVRSGILQDSSFIFPSNQSHSSAMKISRFDKNTIGAICK